MDLERLQLQLNIHREKKEMTCINSNKDAIKVVEKWLSEAKALINNDKSAYIAIFFEDLLVVINRHENFWKNFAGVDLDKDFYPKATHVDCNLDCLSAYRELNGAKHPVRNGMILSNHDLYED